MAYVTVAQIRTEDATLTEANGCPDTVLETLIASVSRWLNGKLNADTITNAAGETAYVDFQNSEATGDSYCTADQLTNIKKIILYEVVSAGNYIKKIDNYETVIQITRGKPVASYPDFNENAKAAKYHKMAVTLMNHLIEQDKEIGSFSFPARQQEGSTFIVINAEPERQGPGEMTMEQILSRLR